MLSSYKLTTSISRTCAKSLLAATSDPFIQQTRNAVILKRRYDPLLHKKGGTPHKLKHKHYIYEVIDNTDIKPKPPLDIILTQYVEGYGEKGTRVSLKPHKAYNDFLLPGLAIYASPENINKYLTTNTTAEKTYSSLYVPMTIKIFSTCCLIVHMSIENPWVLEKWHLRANFRRYGYFVTDESITMPEKEISGPNLDIQGKEFYITLTINKTEKVKVRCRIHHDSYDISKQLAEEEATLFDPKKAIFPEDQEVLDSLPRPFFEEIKKKKKTIR